MDMPAFQLLEPARTNLNLPVSGVDPIADYKMVSQTVLHTALSMLPVIYGRVAVCGAAVMDHYPTPAPGYNVEMPRLLANLFGETNRSLCVPFSLCTGAE